MNALSPLLPHSSAITIEIRPDSFNIKMLSSKCMYSLVYVHRSFTESSHLLMISYFGSVGQFPVIGTPVHDLWEALSWKSEASPTLLHGLLVPRCSAQGHEIDCRQPSRMGIRESAYNFFQSDSLRIGTNRYLSLKTARNVHN